MLNDRSMSIESNFFYCGALQHVHVAMLYIVTGSYVNSYYSQLYCTARPEEVRQRHVQ